MSNGSPRVTIRIPNPLLDEMWTVVTERNERTANEPWDFSAFILAAIREKLTHMKRSRTYRRKRRKDSTTENHSPQAGPEQWPTSETHPSPQSS